MRPRYKKGDTLYIEVNNEIGLYNVEKANRKSVYVVPIVADVHPWNDDMTVSTPLMWSKESKCWTLYGIPIYKLPKENTKNKKRFKRKR